MSLGNFYRQVEHVIMAELIKYTIKANQSNNILILNISTSQHISLEESPNIHNLNISDDPLDFIKNIATLNQSFQFTKYNIINCRFTARIFMSSIDHLLVFLKFISGLLLPGGIFTGYLLDINTLHGLFTDVSSIADGPYTIKYLMKNPTILDFAYHSDDSMQSNKASFNEYAFYQYMVNDELVNVVNFTTLKLLCEQFGLIHIDNIDLKNIYIRRLMHINLKDYEKRFGFLNYFFIFQMAEIDGIDN